MEIFQLQLLTFSLDFTARDSTSESPLVQCVKLFTAVTENVTSLSLQERHSAGGTKAPSLGPPCSTPKLNCLVQPFPSAFEYSVSPPTAQKDDSLESFQPFPQIPKLREFLKGLSLA